jgi:hypothetical protein
MPSTETSPEPTAPAQSAVSDPAGNPVPGRVGEAREAASFVQLLRELAEDSRTLVQQEIELVRLEVARSARRVTVDSAWIGAGAVVITVGLVCLALALALGIGALLDSYWLGTLITAGVFLLLGGLIAWRGIRDLKAGGFVPTGPVDSLREDRDWVRQELDEIKHGLTEET